MGAKVWFVDDRLDEVIRMWQLSGSESFHQLLPLEVFDSVEHTCDRVMEFQPDVVLVGFGLDKPNVTGADVVRALKLRGYSGKIIANSGGGVEQFKRAGITVDGSVDRCPQKLSAELNNYKK